jgi:hypothetical protein
LNYLNLLCLDTAGNSSTIVLGSWYGAQPTNVTLITNADLGVLATWVLKTGTSTSGGGESWSSTNYIATTNGPSLASVNTTPTLLTPVLQAQDGTFYGTDASGNMVKFDQYGKKQWSVPGDTPQIATTDDGVIGASGTTYDSNGKATGQASTATQSWLIPISFSIRT